MALWKPLPRLCAGSVTCFAEFADGSLLAGTLFGLFRQERGASTWARVSNGPRSTLSLAAHPVDNGTIFAGCPGGVYRSLDAGVTWQAVLASPRVTAMAVAAEFVLAATEGDGIFRSADKGATWDAANAGLLGLDVLSLALASDSNGDVVAFAGTTGGLYRSTNDGRSWRGVEVVHGEIAVSALAMSARFASDRTIVVGTEEHGLFRSADGGASWAAIGPGPCSISALAASPDGFAAASGDRVLLLTADDRGEASPPLAAPVLALSFVGDSLFAGLAALGVRVLDQGKWNEAIAGLTAAHIVRLSSADRKVAALGSDGALHVLVGGRWTSSYGINGVPAAAIAAGAKLNWAIGEGKLFRSSNDMGPWTRVAMPANLVPTSVALFDAHVAIVGCADGTVAIARGDSVSPAGACGGGAVVGVAAAGPDIVAATFRGGDAIVWKGREGLEFEEMLRLEHVAADPILSATFDGKAGIVLAGHGTRFAIAELLAGRHPEIEEVDIGPLEICGLAAVGPSIFVATGGGLVASHDRQRRFASETVPPAVVQLTAISATGGALHAADASGALWLRSEDLA